MDRNLLLICVAEDEFNGKKGVLKCFSEKGSAVAEAVEEAERVYQNVLFAYMHGLIDVCNKLVDDFITKVEELSGYTLVLST
jgi:hypothetical protein